MGRIISFLIATFAFIGMAQAAAPASTAFNWSGFYFGGNLGYAHQQWGIPRYDSQVPAGGEKDIKADDFTGGVTFGRNWQNGNTVYGYESDLNFSGLQSNEDGGFSFDSCGCLDIKMDGYASVRGRYGWLLNNGALVYGTGGLIVGHMVYRPADSTPIYGTARVFAPGVIVGAGAEKNVLANNLTAKVELLYYDFGNPNFDTGDTGFNTDMRVWGITPRIGLNAHF